MSLELKVIERQVGKVIINYEELKKALELELTKYSGLVFTEENIAEAKSTRASLNNVAKAINDRRIEEKKDFLKGFEEFENQTKELTEMVKNVSLEIDKQVKEFEEQEKLKKTDKIHKIFDSKNYDRLTLDRFWNEKWLNKGFRLDKIEEEIDLRIKEVEDGIKNIETLSGDDVEKYKDIAGKFLLHLDLSRAIDDYNQEEAHKKRLEEIKARQIDNAATTPKETVKPTIKPDTREIEKEQEFVIAFKVRGSERKLMALSTFLQMNNYEYEKI